MIDLFVGWILEDIRDFTTGLRQEAQREQMTIETLTYEKKNNKEKRNIRVVLYRGK